VIRGVGAITPDSSGLDTAGELSMRLETAESANEAQRVGADAATARAAKAGQVDPKEMAQLRKVSQDFESLFLSYMMKVGRQSGAKGGFWGQTEGEQIFTEMRDDELAKHMAKAGGIGLSKLLVEQLTRTLQAQAKRRVEASDAGD
jgi:flagellar protein FlgJ